MFFHIRPLSTPTIAPKERFSVSRYFSHANRDSTLRDFYRVIIRHDYLNEVIISDLDLFIYENIRNFIIHKRGISTAPTPIVEFNSNFNSKDITSSLSSSNPSTNTPIDILAEFANTSNQQRVRETLTSLQEAYKDQIIYIIDKEQMRIKEMRRWGNMSEACRKITLATFL